MAPHYRKTPNRALILLLCVLTLANFVSLSRGLTVIDICLSDDLGIQEVDGETFVLNCSLSDAGFEFGVYAPSKLEEFENCAASNLVPLETRFPLKMTVEGLGGATLSLFAANLDVIEVGNDTALEEFEKCSKLRLTVLLLSDNNSSGIPDYVWVIIGILLAILILLVIVTTYQRTSEEKRRARREKITAMASSTYNKAARSAQVIRRRLPSRATRGSSSTHTSSLYSTHSMVSGPPRMNSGRAMNRIATNNPNRKDD